MNFLFAACDLAKEQKRNFGDDIASQLRLARKKRWNILEERRICQEIQLQSYLNKLISEDMERRLGQIKLDEDANEDDRKTKMTEIEVECVSNQPYRGLRYTLACSRGANWKPSKAVEMSTPPATTWASRDSITTHSKHTKAINIPF